MSDLPPTTRFVVVVSGFQQSPALRWAGAINLYLEARRRLRQRLDTEVLYCHWHDHPAAAAGLVQMIANGAPRAAIRVYLAAYSWGVGGFAVDFCRHLADLGIGVEELLSIDGVYRVRWLPARYSKTPLALRSLINRGPLAPAIRVPPTVRRVRRFFQRVDKPAGHKLVADEIGQETRWEPAIELDVGHRAMDDAPEVLAAFLAMVDRAKHDEVYETTGAASTIGTGSADRPAAVPVY